jgi:uncharacterized protein
MNTRLLALSGVMALFLVLVLAAATAQAKDWPRPQGPVADYAQVIGPEYKSKITALAQEIWQKTNTALVVATLPSLDNESLEEAASRLYRAWGIGKKGVDKGALILVAVAERRVRIEVGYGLEGALTDAYSGQIRDQVLVPHLKEGRYGQGLYEGLAAIAHLAAKEAKVELSGVPQPRVTYRQPSPYGSWGTWGLIFMVALVLILVKAHRGGGFSGSGGLGGFFTGLMVGSLFGGGRRGGDGSGGGGDGWGGGGGDSGGFGGGDSGGGGASGDY